MRYLLKILLTFCIFLFDVGFLYAGSYVYIDVKLKNLNGTSASNITWSGTLPADTDWKHANQYLEIHYACIKDTGKAGDITDDKWYDGWGIQIFTDNTNKQSLVNPTPYLYKQIYKWAPEEMPDGPDTTPGKDPLCKAEILNQTAGDFAAGLVHVEKNYTLPMCWRAQWPGPFKDPPPGGWSEEDKKKWDKNYNLNIYEVKDSKGVPHLVRDKNEVYYCWFWMKDMKNDGKSNPIKIAGQWWSDSTLKWKDGMDYATVANTQGIHHAEGLTGYGWGKGPLTGQENANQGCYGVIVYLGAKIKDAPGGDYKTKIYVQMYHY